MSFQELCDLPLLAGYVIVLAVVLGAVFGSFLNCMAWRMVHHESVLKGRSHCASCGHPLKAADLVLRAIWPQSLSVRHYGLAAFSVTA